MGLTFKPAKCRTLSIRGGRPDPECIFFLNSPETNQPTALKTLESDPHKFLGAVMTHLNTPQDHYMFLQDKLSTKLANLEASKVRGEYKVAVFNRYLVPSLRYHLTVHNIHKTHLDQLDLSAQKYLKQPVSARTQVVGATLSQWEYLASSYVEGQLKVLGTK